MLCFIYKQCIDWYWFEEYEIILKQFNVLIKYYLYENLNYFIFQSLRLIHFYFNIIIFAYVTNNLNKQQYIYFQCYVAFRKFQLKDLLLSNVLEYQFECFLYNKWMEFSLWIQSFCYIHKIHIHDDCKSIK